LKDVFGRRGVELEEKLFFATGETQRQANLLDQFFLSRLAVLPEYARVMSWLKAIEGQRGMMSILELSRLSGLSVRSVDRLFQQVIGLPPKFVARTVRFRHALHHLMAQPATRWDEIVAALDYFDQAHFIRDVKALAGVDPKTYLAFLSRRRESLAPNHVHLAVLPWRDGSKAPARRFPACEERPHLRAAGALGVLDQKPSELRLRLCVQGRKLDQLQVGTAL